MIADSCLDGAGDLWPPVEVMGNMSRAPASVSVVLPTWNRAHLLPRAIRSVLAQLETGDELIVADDGSTDGTASLVASFGPPVRYLGLPHGGAGAARNAAWRVARGPLVAFLDSDDRWLPGKLAAQRALLAARPDLACCFSDFRTADADGRESPGGLAGWLGGPPDFAARVAAAQPLGTLAPVAGDLAGLPTHLGDFRAAAMRQDIGNIGTMLVRKALVGPELGCAEDLPTFEEIPAVARILGAGPAAYLDGATLVQHDHPGPRLTGGDLIARARARVAVLERAWANDPAFLARHGDELAARLRSERLGLARLLLGEGDTPAARRVLQRTERPPWELDLLARLPAPALSCALAARRGLRRAAAFLPWLPMIG